MILQTVKMDKELFVEKRKQVTECVKKNAKKRVMKKKDVISDEDDENSNLSDYMKKVNLKRKRNDEKIKSLGLNKTPQKTRGRSRRIAVGSPKTTPGKSPKNTQGKRTTSPRPKQKTRQKTIAKKPRIIFTDYGKKMKCKCDHRDLTGYKEETDKRYFKEEMELHGTKCATCKILFADVADVEKECLVPSSNQGTYFCAGRIQYNCRYAFCHNCYIQATEEGGRTRRRNLN